MRWTPTASAIVTIAGKPSGTAATASDTAESTSSIAEALLRIAALGRGHNLRIPHNLLLLMRAVFLLEHAVRTLDLQ